MLGQALVERGILPSDVLIVDTSALPTHGHVAIITLHDVNVTSEEQEGCGSAAPGPTDYGVLIELQGHETGALTTHMRGPA